MTKEHADDLQSQVLALVRSVAENDQIEASTPLFSSGLLDSLALESIQAEIENRWCALPPTALRLAAFDTAAAISATVYNAKSEANHQSTTSSEGA
ncbi:phosphopantetheine-binding protein [Rhodococcus sp. 06-235-1A]|uniref:phosphopantetheine-binding protein n=1 Tax=Rhodococcus sp. 06-235-1A TaxID=2022508 RepID=UPI00117A3457|nr:phosphopantetheine-binding protein [Rhodococcus sp. 06-235-1A]